MFKDDISSEARIQSGALGAGASPPWSSKAGARVWALFYKIIAKIAKNTFEMHTNRHQIYLRKKYVSVP